MSESATSLIEPPVAARGAPMLTVVVPCYNERPNVAPLIARLDAALHGIAWEVVYVDDNSPDGTAAEVRRIAQTDPRVRCIRRIGRRGLASAVIEGALSSSAQYVAVIDGDLQHDETKLPDMLAALRDRPLRPRRRQPSRRGRRRRRPGQSLAPHPVGRRHPAGAALPAGAADRSDERLLHAAAPAVRAAGGEPDRPGVQDPARSGAQLARAAAGDRDSRPCSTSASPARASSTRWC